MAEEKGLIGKAWDAVQDILKNMTSSGKQAFMTKLAQEDRQFVIDAFKKKLKEFKENSDGSIECVRDGSKRIYSWVGNISRMTIPCSNGNSLISDLNLETDEGIDSITNADGTFKHEVKYDKDGNLVSVKNYEKNETGEMVESDKFAGADLNTGEIYTGFDLAKIFAEQNYTFTTDFESFIKTICHDVKDVYGARSGPYNITMNDGTEITTQRQWPVFRNRNW